MIQRHIRQGQVLLDQQKATILRLEANDELIEAATSLLMAFETTMSLHLDHLARLQAI